MASPQQPGRAELLPRYLYFSSVLKGRRVLEVGAVASTEGLSAHFLAKLSLEVTAVDSSAEAVNRAQKSLGRPGLDFREGPLSKLRARAYDVVIASDVTDSAIADELVRLVARKGFLICAVRDGNGITLSGRTSSGSNRVAEKIIASLSQQFESVAVVWQRPVLGYEISFEEAAEPAIDSSLAAGVEPAYQLIIASAETPELPVSTSFRLSHDFVELADRGAYKALEAELHALRIELVEKEAQFHSLGGRGAKDEDTAPQGLPQPQLKLLAAAHEQMKLAAEQIKANNEKLVRMKESVAAERAARTTAEKELAKLRDGRTDQSEKLLVELDQVKSWAARAEAETAAQLARLEQAHASISRTKAQNTALEQKLAQAEGAAARSAAESALRLSKLEQRFAEAEANAGRFGAAVRDQAKKLAETEAALAAARFRLGELEEEAALSSTMESNALADEKRRVEELQTQLLEVTAREARLTQQLSEERAQAAVTDRNFASVMRELREALDAKEELEKQVANERLERARLERMRQA